MASDYREGWDRLRWPEAFALWEDSAVDCSDALLDDSRRQGDPFADEVVQKIFASGSIDRVNELMGSLVRNDELIPASLPAEVGEYLATDLLPTNVDRARIERSEVFFQTWGLQISMCLFCASLPSAYAAADGVKVLYETARLQTDRRRRVFETGQFLMDVMDPGGLAAGGDGIRVIQRVRLMHAAVRQLILHDGTWDTKRWGVPINQEDLAGTMMSFSYVPVEPMARLGIDVTASDIGDYLYMWNIVGEMIGVRPELRPANQEEATALVAAIRRRQNRGSPEGAAMTAALVELLEELTPQLGHRGSGPAHVRGLGRLVPVVIRHLIGNPTADLISVPKARSPLMSLFEPLLKLIGVFESDVEHDAHVKRLVEPFARAVLVGAFDAERGGIRAPFAIPDTLARTWELSQ